MKPGPKPKPYLQAVREGNPSHKPLVPGVVLPPTDLVEPNWAQRLPGASPEQRRVRRTAAATWKQLAPVLARSVGLVAEQQEVLVEYCVCIARIEQGERSLSADGVVVKGDRGTVRNPWTTVLNGYRAQLRAMTGELGLSPSAATRLPARDLDDDDDPFDP